MLTILRLCVALASLPDVPPVRACLASVAIVRAAGDHDPALLAALFYPESGFNNAKVNPRSGACGIGQVLYSHDHAVQVRRCRRVLGSARVGARAAVRKLDDAVAFCVGRVAARRYGDDACAIAGYIGGPSVVRALERGDRWVVARIAATRARRDAIRSAAARHGAQGDPATGPRVPHETPGGGTFFDGRCLVSDHRPWLAVACETCHADAGALCRIDGLGPVAFAHPARLAAWTALTIQRASAPPGPWLSRTAAGGVTCLQPTPSSPRLRARARRADVDEIVIDDIDGDRLTVEDATTGPRRLLGLTAKTIDDGLASEIVHLNLTKEAVATLRDALTAWLDAPRDAARAKAEVVVHADGYILARTTLGEWGVAEEGEIGAAWFADEDRARGHFAAVRGFARCEGCKAEVEIGADDVVLCDACAGELVPA